ncbi:dienelactone hydrolase family protein [Haloplanus sp. C73]|uniref:dienelactone hydrolase family protein n=1 Tax=Haloplanus sp. C73 TaxID=3421641 RepID=UPI003EB9E246
MPVRSATIVVVAALVLVSGCSGLAPTTDTESASPTPEASYTQTPHMGCQPGAIRENGTCQPVTSGANADIFSAENLSAVRTSRTTIDGTPGYLARPDDNGTYPSVVVIHEWWGLNENVEHMAEILAGHGYVVFAVDLYDGEVASNASEAGRLSGQVRENPDVAVSKMSRAVSGLRARSDTTDQVASLGWCFGGGQSLQLSLSDADLNATVIYYGTLTTDAETLQRVDEPVLGVFGSEDEVVGIENVRAFDRTLDDVGAEHEVYVYEGAGHAFANPSGESFRPNATRDAWGKTLRFLDDNLNESAS